MSSFSDDLHIFRCVRNAGVPHPQNTKIRIGGRYHPAHVNAQGVDVSARWTGSFAINRRGFKHPTTDVLTEVPPDFIRITAWSGKAAAGNGLAERYSRFMSKGLEVSLNAVLRNYTVDQYDGNTRICRADGTPIQIEKTGFTAIPGSILIGNESEKHIQDEIVAFEGSQGQQGRPRNWDNRAHPDFQIWSAIIAKKNAEMYQPGMAMFGFAIVIPPKGAQTNVYNRPGTVADAAAPLVEGFTLEQWKAQNPTFTNEQFLAHPKFALFHDTIRALMVGGTLVTPGADPANPMVLNQPTGAVLNQPADASEAAFNGAAY